MSVTTANPSPQLQQPSAQRVISAFGLLLFVAGAVLPVFLSGHAWIAAVRWAGLLLIASTGLWRQSLTRWIFFAMLLGGEIGLDRPQFAEHLRVLSEIFLRLIKVIVAPLIFGTLVAGIAGHGNLRGVGRIGLKSLIYFEIVTTLALFLGVAAINLSRAGEGLAISQTATANVPQNAAPLRWDDFMLHIFPENIAK
jgi:proton glutamate symport protein